MKKVISVIMTLIILTSFSGVLSAGGLTSSIDPQNNVVSEEKTIENISITSDQELKDFANETDIPGDGSEEQPYVLENYTIKGDREGHALYLHDTDLHFQIRRCKIIDSDIGIEINSVSNFTFESNVIKDTRNGLRIRDSHENLFENNNFTDTEKLAVEIIGTSRKNIFYENELDDSSFSLRRADHHETQNIASNNTVDDLPIIHIKNTEYEAISGRFGQLMISNSEEIEIDSVNISGGSIGVEIIDSRNIYIEDIDAKNFTMQAVYADFCPGLRIKDSYFEGNDEAVSVMECSNTEITKNEFKENRLGIKSTSSSNITLSQNVLNQNQRGILFQDSKDSYITDNQISNTTSLVEEFFISGGLSLWNSNNNTITENILLSNSIGINFQNSSQNLVYNNLNIDNDIQAQDDGMNDWSMGDPTDGGEGGNYWSDHEAEDRGDGISEEPFLIERGENEDRYPLTAPVGPPVNIDVSPIGADHVNITWDEPFYSIGSPVQNITLYRASEQGNLSSYEKMRSTSRYHIDYNVQEGEQYSYALKASNLRYESVMSKVHTAIPDSSTPEIDEYDPRGDEVPVDTEVMVRFSEEMDEESINISIDGVGGEIRGEGTTFYFTPYSNLSYAKRYHVNVTGTDLAGNQLEDESFAWSFRTISNGSIKGRVVDEDGEPLEDVRITADGTHVTFTDEDGLFELEVPQGNITLEISKEDYETRELDLTIRAGEIKDIEGDILLEKPEGIISRTFWPMALVGAIVLLLGVLAALVTLKNWEEQPPPDEDMYEEDYEEVSEEEFKSWWEDES